MKRALRLGDHGDNRMAAGVYADCGLAEDVPRKRAHRFRRPCHAVRAAVIMYSELMQAGRYLGQSMRLMVGLPAYSTYVSHMEASHPGEQLMTYEEFFRERQQARYGGAGKRGGYY